MIELFESSEEEREVSQPSEMQNLFALLINAEQ